ncbi:hypothetical protein MLD38_029492 [Melastoma candidum]|uniref:Uncharacterized protein n=1 Tax=Melastoma candidum TaxID=119954 RepID=A0ACB9N6H6_9MYRT|nr:hypothetical protein MLD38_029492 [Melastoma candidum]
MASPTMALYANPPSAVCSPSHQINDLQSSPSSATTASSSSLPRHVMGGLSSLFSSPVTKQSSAASLPLSFSSGLEEKAFLFHDSGDEFSSRERALSSSMCYSPGKFFGSSRREWSSPVSVLHGPISCCRTDSHVSTIGSRVLYNGFVRNALGNSFVDRYGHSPASPVAIIGGMADQEELTFTLEENCGQFGNGDQADYSVEELLVGAQAKHSIFREEFVVKAFYEAERAHRGQVRASGHPYLQHCVETAVLLASIGATSTVVAAGLLHDTMDDSFTSYDHISRTFGACVANLVDGVSKLSHLSQLARENDTASKTVEADRLHTMFLAMADARAVLIKLADRLHNMMTLEALPAHKQQRFAKETLEIFVPLANRLGISTWKECLENLCFKHLHHELHEKLSSQLLESYDETIVITAKEKLKEALDEKSLPYHLISARHKSLYSVYCKMIKKNLGMDEIHDVHGVRLIVETEEDCYRALRIVHQLWPEVPGKLKDYIVSPKFNGYRSLHTVVMSERMVPIEVQIRTKEMHLQAEFGLAAHWRYKEGDCKHSSFVLQMVEWARWVIAWQCETMNQDRWSVHDSNANEPHCRFPSHSDDCGYSCKPHCDSNGPVFVILFENEKMSVQEFPADSTIVDLLARAGRGIPRWTPYGFPLKEDLRPRVNGLANVDPTRKLNMGDVVELMPATTGKSLTEYREEIQRMYDRGLPVSGSIPAVDPAVGKRS